MPHMMPMMWSLIMMFSLMILFMIISMTYFIYNPSYKSFKSTHLLESKPLWNWKW